MDNDEDDWKQFESVLLSWNNMTLEQKNKNFSKFTSYELHLFLKKFDHDYFTNVIQGFISSKMEKFFMDYYLLNDTTQILRFANMDKLSSLNTFEQCLLIDTLVRTKDANNKALAQKIAEKMQMKID